MGVDVSKGYKGILKQQKGFSLIELMIVLVIIGVLAAIAIPNMLDAKVRAQQKATLAELRNWGNALGAYMAETGVVPAGGGGPVVASTVFNELVPYAVSALHIDDAWNNDLFYFALNSVSGTSYTVASGGRHGVLDNTCITPATWFIYNDDIAINDGLFICSPS